jgi:glycosyltransferase involved in cell wall biosynthesis
VTVSRVRILYLIGDLTTGGSERHLVHLLQRLDRSRFEPHLALQRVAGPLLDLVRRADVPIHDLGFDRSRLSFITGFFRLRKLVAGLRPEIVQSYGYPTDVHCALLRSGGARRILTTRRGNNTIVKRRILYRLTNPLVHAIVCVSSATADFTIRTERVAARKIVVIPNGLDVERFALAEPLASPRVVIGSLGRLREVKGPDLLLEAFARHASPDVEVVFGGPADDAWGRHLVDRWGGTPGVRFAGEIGNVADYLEALDVFVLPSRSEGMSNTLLEAMATGLPIIATDVGSNREVLDDGRCGLVVPADAEAIARALGQVLADREEARRMGRRARDRAASQFGLDRMVRRYEELYGELA